MAGGHHHCVWPVERVEFGIELADVAEEQDVQCISSAVCGCRETLEADCGAWRRLCAHGGSSLYVAPAWSFGTRGAIAAIERWLISSGLEPPVQSLAASVGQLAHQFYGTTHNIPIVIRFGSTYRRRAAQLTYSVVFACSASTKDTPLM